MDFQASLGAAKLWTISMAPSSAGKFLKKMHEIQLIIDGKARGKHLFSKTFFTIRSMTDDK